MVHKTRADLPAFVIAEDRNHLLLITPEGAPPDSVRRHIRGCMNFRRASKVMSRHPYWIEWPAAARFGRCYDALWTVYCAARADGYTYSWKAVDLQYDLLHPAAWVDEIAKIRAALCAQRST